MSDLGKDWIVKIQKSGEKLQKQVDLRNDNIRLDEILRAISSKFHHMPDEDITILERQVAKLLVSAGYLRLEPLVYEPNCEILEYVVATQPGA